MSSFSTRAGSVEEPVEFNGRAGEWFGIWIINLLLTIVTIGIYSAWAKVRREQYFKRNTVIGGRSFDYHATGWQILKGRLILIGAYILLNLVLVAFPPLGIILLIGLLVAIPWLIVNALKFNARVTSWANVRFDFNGSKMDAFITFMLLPIGVMLTLYTTLPFLSRRANRFAIGGHSIGNHRFDFSASIGSYYKAFGISVAWIVIVGGLMIASVLPALTVIFSDPAALEDPANIGMMGAFIGVIYGVLFVAILPAALIYRAFLRNTIINGVSLEGGHRMFSDISPMKFIWIALSNAVVIVLTLGLMLPWAQIRMTTYLASKTSVLPNGSLDQLHGQVQAEGTAAGDAFGDFEGIDMGLPV
ncbi:YjgN family protein [Aestuariibius sp. 2305UL40-4]|uniref:YjgN family protein n=1 Tax=Aestuariibius violaceus TaxID=3234132 RepID=UPI00345E80D6